MNREAEHVEFRQAVHTILHAISSTRGLREIMVMKGGILLALGYESTRFTRDIDFSTEKKLKEFNAEEFKDRIDAALVDSVEKLRYGVDCRVQGWKQKPRRKDADFATIEFKVGYANRNDQRAQRRLMLGEALHLVRVDYSLNEPRGDPEIFEIEDGQSIQIYSFHDLVAEKFRALLQQELRNRFRRQDVYDLHLLLKRNDDSTSGETKSRILHSLKEKAAARNLPVLRKSMRNPEIIRRSRDEYDLLEHEIEGPLPDFDEAYEFVRSFYEALPWQ